MIVNELAVALQKIFLKKGLTLALAESCTGGRVSAALTAIPGSSQYFLGSVVSYSNALKMKWLSIPPVILEEHGAVSEETAKAMAEGLLEVTHADWAASVTGIAGPGGGTNSKPVGTVWIALVKRGGAPRLKALALHGERTEIQEQAVETLLKELLLAVETSVVEVDHQPDQ